ncbi:MAG: GNAT family N-acetyltransferase, partial [Firmicutes bacterium]|nr:GNAT family N-acetyltransferase [Bacillota bacterium]
MKIRQAVPADLPTVAQIVRMTIRTVYPHYYPAGAVDFFLAHHADERIAADIAAGRVFLLADGEA